MQIKRINTVVSLAAKAVCWRVLRLPIKKIFTFRMRVEKCAYRITTLLNCNELCAGLIMVKSLATWQPTLLYLHKSFGIVTLTLVIIRLLVRAISVVPALPSSLSNIQKAGAKASLYLLYALILVLPITGFLMQYNAGRPVDFFGFFTLPAALTNAKAALTVGI